MCLGHLTTQLPLRFSDLYLEGERKRERGVGVLDRQREGGRESVEGERGKREKGGVRQRE